MDTLTVRAKVGQNGTLTLPEKAREELGLQQGDEVELTLHKPSTTEPSPDENPLLGIIGIGKGGPKDGAENHDESLYRRHSA